MTFSTLSLHVEDYVGTITLLRESAANSMNLEMAKDLMNVAIECDVNPEIRAVVITGSGSTFSTGGDLKNFYEQGERLPAHIKEITVYLDAAISRFTRMDAPVISAVNGVAAGGGMSLAIAADFVVAAESARFTMGYTKAGLTPDISGSYFLPRIVGIKRALELTLLNPILSAKDALDLGIVTKVVPDADLLHEANSIASILAHGALSAIGETKRLLHQGWYQTLETQMENESQTIAKMSTQIEATEGIQAFLEKRSPKFI